MIWFQFVIMFVLVIIVGAVLYSAIGPLAVIWNLAGGIFLGWFIARSR